MSTKQPVTGLSIGQYLIQRLQDYDIRDTFGVPGDYILNFYSMLEASPINTVGCTREDCAGFAADAYARINGMGVVVVTYCVGGLSVANSIAGAYAEKSPVVLISGSPGLRERVNNPLLHHKVRDFRTQYEVFEKLCCAGAELIDPATAFREIDRVLDTCARFKRPVYLELPRDMIDVVPSIAYTYHGHRPSSNEDALEEATDEAMRLLNNCQRPLILAGVEVHRFGLQDQLLALAEAAQIPIAATILGKSVVSEKHPLYVGLYEGAMGYEDVTRYVEQSDCLLMFGCFMTDLNMGIWTAQLDPARCISASSEELRIRHHYYHDVQLHDFLRVLGDKRPAPPLRKISAEIRTRQPPYEMQPDKPITITQMIARLNQQIDEHTVIVADIGDALFGATALEIHGRTEFISPAYYTSMGFAVPATLGVHVARADARVVAIVGDGAFQMTGTELSTVVRRGYCPVVIVLDNGGYGTERFLHAGDYEYNDIQNWDYAKLPAVLGGGTGYHVRTEAEFDEALSAAWSDTSGMSLIQVHISEDDSSEALKRLAEKLSLHV
jgi:indolepyruvate decarboxylase